ncbi:hypothetical protein [Arenimonas caeni]|uniref:Uncharacterized protein n=1 Tax=Arenimonas caeni TaxID=2058085 RepID=A0A2P6M9H3_9GAMM|nr:hypothetical protein [Arenimonas caeni]PRH82625.1 hypothetical protein C6N40_06535 [Arenimonas caeni]
MVQDDMHTHRRRDDTDDTKGHRLEAAAESTFAKLLNRFVMPILFGVVAFFVSDTLKDIRSGQEAQGQAISELKTEFRVLTTRLDEVVIRQVNANSGQLVNHEQRLQALEREGRNR